MFRENNQPRPRWVEPTADLPTTPAMKRSDLRRPPSNGEGLESDLATLSGGLATGSKIRKTRPR